jgi:hypothetical protein
MLKALCYSLFPYIPKKRSSTLTDDERTNQGLLYALKDNRGLLVDGVPTDCCEVVLRSIKRVDPSCAALAPDRVLIPMPRSHLTPTDVQEQHTQWANFRLCELLVAHGSGSHALAALVRKTALERSAHGSQGKAERPTVQQHLDSMDIVLPVSALTRVTLVDDMLTCGTQLAAAVEKLRRAGFAGDVVGFTFCQNHDEWAQKKDKAVFEVYWDGEASHANRTMK